MPSGLLGVATQQDVLTYLQNDRTATIAISGTTAGYRKRSSRLLHFRCSPAHHPLPNYVARTISLMLSI